MIRWIAVLCFMASGAVAENASLGAGAILRGLDKVSGKTTDIEMGNGTTAEYGRLIISLGECRYPAGNPSGDAWAFVTIRDKGATDNAFSGWMVASSPALNALDHSRYDVWVMRCKTK